MRWGEGHLQSQLLPNFFQNIICLWTIHKCEKRQTTLINGRGRVMTHQLRKLQVPPKSEMLWKFSGWLGQNFNLFWNVRLQYQNLKSALKNLQKYLLSFGPLVTYWLRLIDLIGAHEKCRRPIRNPGQACQNKKVVNYKKKALHLEL